MVHFVIDHIKEISTCCCGSCASRKESGALCTRHNISFPRHEFMMRTHGVTMWALLVLLVAASVDAIRLGKDDGSISMLNEDGKISLRQMPQFRRMRQVLDTHQLRQVH